MNRHLCTEHKPYCNCDPTRCHSYSTWKRQLWALDLPERESFFLDHTDKEEMTQEKWLTAMRDDLICPYFRCEQPHFDGDLSKIKGKRFRWNGMLTSAIICSVCVGMFLFLLYGSISSAESSTVSVDNPTGTLLLSILGLIFFAGLFVHGLIYSFRIVAVTNEHGLYLPCGVFPWDEITGIDYQIGMRHSRYNRDPDTVALMGKNYRIILMNLPKSLLKEARAYKPSLALTIVKANGKRKPF